MLLYKREQLELTSGAGDGGSPMRVFVASTYEDLLNYREAATRSVLTSGNITEDMFYWPATERPPLAASITRLRSSDLMILLMAHRYGTPPPGREASITELEFDEAMALRIPVLAFQVDPTYPWQPNHVETDPGIREKLVKFIQSVKTQVTVRQFTSPESLEVAITNSLVQFTAEARDTRLPHFAQERVHQVSRPESLYYSADSTVEIGHAPDGAPLLISITRKIRIENDLAAIAAQLGKSLQDPSFTQVLADLNQEARSFAAKARIYDSTANGSPGKFYVPDEPLTQQVSPSLFQSMLGTNSAAITTAIPPENYAAPGPPSFSPTVQPYGYPPSQPSYGPPHFAAPAPTNLGGNPASNWQDFDHATTNWSGVRARAENPEAEPKVISLGGLNRFLCIALDSSPTTWSGGWAIYPSGRRKFVIGRPFIEEGLERLPGVHWTIRQANKAEWHGELTVGSDQPNTFIEKWTELLSGASDARLREVSYKIKIPRSSIARFTLEVIDEIAGLHERGKIHADIKPSNILISRNGPLLIDDADLSIGDISPTITSGWSPSEQLLRKPLSAAADVFALGQLLLRVLAAEPLGREVRYRMPGGQMVFVFDDPTVYIESGNPHVPFETRGEWCRLIERALRTNPDERWPTVRAMAEEMRALLDQGDLTGDAEIMLPWGDRPSLILDAEGRPTAAWIIKSGHEQSLLRG
jgi:hypothetical protein